MRRFGEAAARVCVGACGMGFFLSFLVLFGPPSEVTSGLSRGRVVLFSAPRTLFSSVHRAWGRSVLFVGFTRASSVVSGSRLASPTPQTLKAGKLCLGRLMSRARASLSRALR